MILWVWTKSQLNVSKIHCFVFVIVVGGRKKESENKIKSRAYTVNKITTERKKERKTENQPKQSSTWSSEQPIIKSTKRSII